MVQKLQQNINTDTEIHSMILPKSEELITPQPAIIEPYVVPVTDQPVIQNKTQNTIVIPQPPIVEPDVIPVITKPLIIPKQPTTTIVTPQPPIVEPDVIPVITKPLILPKQPITTDELIQRNTPSTNLTPTDNNVLRHEPSVSLSTNSISKYLPYIIGISIIGLFVITKKK